MQFKANLLLLLLMAAFSVGVNPVVGKEEASDFTLVDIDGNTFSLFNCSAKVVLMDFFGTECVPCVKQIPALRRLYVEYPRYQLEVISISPENAAVLRDFAQEQNMEWIVACDPGGEINNQYGVQYIPTLFIIDADGYIRYKHVGLTGESKLRSEISLLSPITVLSPRNITYTATSVPLNFTTSEAGSWVGYSLDGGEQVVIHGNTTLDGLTDGPHNIVVYFKSSSDNLTYLNKMYFRIGSTPTEPWLSLELIGIIVAVVILLLIAGIVVAGQLLGWSEPAKKRRKHKRSSRRRSLPSKL